MPEDANIIPEVSTEGTPTTGMTFTVESAIETPPSGGMTFDTDVEKPAATEVIENEEKSVVTEEKEVVVPEVKPATETTEPKPEEWDEEKAFKFLKEKRGFEANSIEEILTPKEAKKLAPIVEKYQEFIEKTGNDNYSDFLETQKDWSQVEPEEALRAMMTAQNPELSDREIDFLYNRKYSIDGLDDEMDEDLILERNINAKTDLKKAQEFLENRKQEYAVKGGSGDYVPAEFKEAKEFRDNLLKEQEAIELSHKASREDYVSKIENHFKDFDGIKVRLGNDEVGYEEVSFKPENVNEVKERYMDIANFNSKFFDEKGSLKDAKAWVEALYIAENFQTEVNKAYNRGMAKRLEIDDKLSKNIQPDNIRDVNSPTTKGMTFTVIRD